MRRNPNLNGAIQNAIRSITVFKLNQNSTHMLADVKTPNKTDIIQRVQVNSHQVRQYHDDFTRVSQVVPIPLPEAWKLQGEMMSGEEAPPPSFTKTGGGIETLLINKYSVTADRCLFDIERDDVSIAALFVGADGMWYVVLRSKAPGNKTLSAAIDKYANLMEQVETCDTTNTVKLLRIRASASPSDVPEALADVLKASQTPSQDSVWSS